MTVADEVLAAARRRSAALAAGDAAELAEVLHPLFRWTSHRGESFERDAYIHRNTGGGLRWQSQVLAAPAVAVVGDTAVLHAVAVDTLWPATETAGSTEPAEMATFRMPVTQTWTRVDGRWLCLAGHGGPLQP